MREWERIGDVTAKKTAWTKETLKGRILVSCVVTLEGVGDEPLLPLIDRVRPFDKFSDAMLHYLDKADRKVRDMGMGLVRTSRIPDQEYKFNIVYSHGVKCGEGIIRRKPCQTSECTR